MLFAVSAMACRWRALVIEFHIKIKLFLSTFRPSGFLQIRHPFWSHVVSTEQYATPLYIFINYNFQLL
jgi:hypothetical protein